ncbi:hypothetical protein GLOIN_2v1789791 [Rhizophagus irregularis DAOM 181602=DAOM 197198]|uniref:Uncharacterized protein n=1 Tax=Rhizophagus irregularis (strain DAOM 181602 / DAOM 197198 / MUCL 43194) TaxID=747089 RepID=A0A2P4P0H9_RHIID|nr:hypothetical protein GLOIN_2v1789791 [Rhizophagus irregularis DAOM 181602=DAOM 197198]POG58890.1 hypothetical protein GLOIN_2v1789791 [Rhizophagus irregularis DAOM 181602=DAOM 197198]|eukprot:XP_025165756.1 hypothetical protein GLOIN_2v1789791 [Rhizophagus irregularis DAOM 181602=DAOM 197198]
MQCLKKHEPKALEKYAKSFTTTEKNTDHVKELVRGIIEGETRVIAAAMTIMFQERKGSRKNDVGVKEREGLTRRETAKIEAILAEIECKASIAEAEPKNQNSINQQK